MCKCVSVQDLLDVVTKENEVDATEADLSDDEEQVHRPTEKQETEEEHTVRCQLLTAVIYQV